MPYLETNKAISFANDIFGYGGWASQVVNLSVDYVRISNRKYIINHYYLFYIR